MFDIPQAPAAANKKQRERLRKQQEQLDAKRPPKGPEAAKEIIDDICRYFTTEGLEKEVIDLLLQLSHSKTAEESKGKLHALKADQAKRFQRPSQKLPGYSHLIEYCCAPDSNIGKVAEELAHKITVVRVTEQDNSFANKTHQRLLDYVKDHPGVSIHGSIPCTAWSACNVVIVTPLAMNSNVNLKHKGNNHAFCFPNSL